jgi:seryl-tRNA synthetase
MTALQWIVKEAKSLKKSYPKRFTKWTDYVKQASAIYASKHKGKSPVGKKKAAPKKVAVKKIAKKKVGVIKKKAEKKPSEKSILNKIHKVKHEVDRLDEAQHKHMSSIGNIAIEKYKKVNDDILKLQNAILKNINTSKKFQYKTPFWKKYFTEKNKKINSFIKELKIHAKELKKHI